MKIGDRVSLIDDDFRGEVIAIKGSDVLVKDHYGFEHSFKKSELTLVDELLYRNKPVIVKAEAQKKQSKKKIKSSELKLDLHFDQLVENPGDYSPWERLFIQKQKLNDTIIFCKENKIKNLLIIHGIGDGTLQEMVLHILEGETGIEYDGDDFFKNQRGITTVSFYK